VARWRWRSSLCFFCAPEFFQQIQFSIAFPLIHRRAGLVVINQAEKVVGVTAVTIFFRCMRQVVSPVVFGFFGSADAMFDRLKACCIIGLIQQAFGPRLSLSISDPLCFALGKISLK